MGWSNCGNDSTGRPIGYGFEAVCDQDGCKEEIDRGLAFACGDMHGHNGHDCELYFCEKHLNHTETVKGELLKLCGKCLETLKAEGLEMADK